MDASDPKVFRREFAMCSYKPDQAIEDPHRLGTRKHCRTLIPMSEEARKPRFAPKDADGALGGSFTAVRD